MNFSATFQRVAGATVIASAVVFGTAAMSPSYAVTIGPEVAAFNDDSNPTFTCPKNKPCLSGLNILINSGDDTVLEAAEDIFGFGTGSLTIWDKFDLGNSQSRDGNFSVETGVAHTSSLLDRPDTVNKWSLNSSGPISFDPSGIVGFAAKFGNYTAFFGFRSEDLPVPNDLEVLFYDLEFYDEFLDVGLLELQNNGKFGGLSHVTIFGQTAVVPLPAALPLAAAGLAVFGLLGWRKHRRTA